MAPILTMASTNDVATLDVAAVRSARFDSIIEVGQPDTDAAAEILARYLDGIPGAENVNVTAVAARFPSNMSGADIREVVRRTVLSGRRHGVHRRPRRHRAVGSVQADDAGRQLPVS